MSLMMMMMMIWLILLIKMEVSLVRLLGHENSNVYCDHQFFGYSFE